MAALVGRVDELREVGLLLARVESGSVGLLLTGEPGIGKTVLWEAGIEAARQRSLRLLSCRCVEAEASLSFSGLSDLLSPVLDEVASALAAPRLRALKVALLLREPGATPLDPRAVGMAVLDALGALAERGPVLVAVDDAQWLDAPSAGALGMALRRLQEERVGVLATVRSGLQISDGLALGHTSPPERLTRLSLRPLSVGALHHLLRDRLAVELTRPQLLRLREVTGGNPFFALELGRELKRTGASPEPGRALPVPDDLAALVAARLARLRPETRDVLLAVAALHRPTVELIAAAYSPGQVQAALEDAQREGVIELDGSRVRFTHPLLASFCYEQAPVWTRRDVHRVLAGVVRQGEERARHLALAADGPDEDIAADLEVAASTAEARGAIAAAELLDLAAEMTPPERGMDRRRRRLRRAWVYYHAGARQHAVALLEQLLAEAAPGPERSDVLFQLVALRMPAPLPDVIGGFELALTEAAGDDARRSRILAVRSSYRLNHDPRGALLDARAALAAAEAAGEIRSIARAIARIGYAETNTLERTTGLLERGLELEAGLEVGQPFMFYDSPKAMLGVRMMFGDDLEGARAILEPKAEMGSDAIRVYALFHLVVLDWLAGRWREAVDRAAAALELADQVEDQLVRAWILQAAALVEAHLGDVEQARANAEESLAISRALSDEITTIGNLGVLGHVELMLGNLESAAASLRDLPSRLVSLGWNEPSSSVWPDTIETLISLGELAQARTYLGHYEERARRASRRSLASAARCAGLLAAAEGDLGAAVESFERALADLAKLPYPFERGRTLLARGSALRKARQKRSAREALEQAQTVFEELGARLWAQKASDERRRISGRRPATGELTETEQRVASLAAEGLANKQIAATLFMSVHTVEWHLTHVYRKLGVHSRAELAHQLAQTPEGAVKA